MAVNIFINITLTRLKNKKKNAEKIYFLFLVNGLTMLTNE